MKTFKTSEGEIFTERQLQIIPDFIYFDNGIEGIDKEDIKDILNLEVGEQVYIGTEWVERIK